MTPRPFCVSLSTPADHGVVVKYVLSTSARFVCPSCGSSELSRSHRKGLYEYLLCTVFHVKPYRCLKCDYRHYRYRPSDTRTNHGNVISTAPK